MVMDTTLVVNPGSSSKKYALYEGSALLGTFVFEKTREGFGKCFEVNGVRRSSGDITEKKYEDSLDEVFSLLISEGILQESTEVTKVGIRIVAPGTFFQSHRKIDDYFLSKLKAAECTAPLHIPLVVGEIEKLKKTLPQAAHIGVSDSAFHATLPPHVRMYSISRKDTETFDVYRFGYHGLSVSSVVRSVPLLLDLLPERMIICHIGSGVSVTALRHGVSIDTSMGFSPASGLMMGSRAGDIDPGALIYLLEKKDLDDGEAHAYIQREGGFQGLLGTSDLRVALDRCSKGDPKAEEAVRMFFYRIQKQIGASIAVLGGIDALILTATAPKRNSLVRALVCRGLEYFGIEIDEEKNELLEGKEGIISKGTARSAIAVVHTDEMGEIARITNLA